MNIDNDKQNDRSNKNRYIRCSIYWDYENIQIPKDYRAVEVIERLESFLESIGWKVDGKWNVYGNDRIPKVGVRHDLESRLGYSVIDASSPKSIRMKDKREKIADDLRRQVKHIRNQLRNVNNENNAETFEDIIAKLDERIAHGIEELSNEQVDMRIIADMLSSHIGCTYHCNGCDDRLERVYENRGVVLISDDADFSYCLSRLKSRVQVLVITRTRVAAEIRHHAHKIAYWRNILKEENEQVVPAIETGDEKSLEDLHLESFTPLSDRSSLPTERNQVNFEVSDLVDVVKTLGGRVRETTVCTKLKAVFSYDDRKFEEVRNLAIKRGLLVQKESKRGNTTLQLVATEKKSPKTRPDEVSETERAKLLVTLEENLRRILKDGPISMSDVARDFQNDVGLTLNELSQKCGYRWFGEKLFPLLTYVEQCAKDAGGPIIRLVNNK